MPNPLSRICAIMLSLLATVSYAEAVENLLFRDNFQRNETQEVKDELGGNWGTNSAKRAGGNKQVDLRDGAMYIVRHKAADHAVSVVHPAIYKDCLVRLRFRLDDERDDLGIDFADMKCKEVHAGHICKVFFRPTGIEILDFKNGRMKKTFRDATKGKKKTKEQIAALEKWQRKFKQPIELKKWHDAAVEIRGETLSVKLNGKVVTKFSSPGMDHPTKDMIRFSARREACLDDIEMFALSPTTTSNAPDSKREVNHLYVAKLLLRKLKNVELTEKQRTKFNQMSADLRARIDALRSKAGITQQLIKRRDEVYSQLKKTSLTGDQLWKTLQEEAGLTDTQRDAFRETLRQNKQFRSDVLKLLTPEQRAKFAKRR